MKEETQQLLRSSEIDETPANIGTSLCCSTDIAGLNDEPTKSEEAVVTRARKRGLISALADHPSKGTPKKLRCTEKSLSKKRFPQNLPHSTK